VPGTLPTQRALPTQSTPHDETPAPRHPRRTAVLVVGSSVLLLGALVAGIAIKLDRDAEAAAWAAAEGRVAVDVAAQQADEEFFAERAAAVTVADYDALVAAAVAQAGTVVSDAQGTLAASPHAGDQNLAALQQAADAVSASAASVGKGTSLAALRASQQAVQTSQQAAAEAQAAWQAAEDARIAAERAAAEQAAAAAAAQRSSSRQSTPRAARSTGSAPAAAATAPAAAPASSWAAGVESYGISGLGAAINAQRAANGLPALSVTGSSKMANHAAEMAAAGSIWHSGSDHIVGWVQPASAEQMIQAYMNSPSHRAWILKEGKSTVSIGAVTYNGRLYTAMVFS
jgi:chemotaxis protein histidine kinase CheA